MRGSLHYKSRLYTLYLESVLLYDCKAQHVKDYGKKLECAGKGVILLNDMVLTSEEFRSRFGTECLSEVMNADCIDLNIQRERTSMTG